MTNNKQLGGRGEALAAEYLQGQGYRIIEKNYRLGRLEIDLIAQQLKQLIFIEVKTRIKTADSLQENPLTRQQVHNLQKAIARYCQQHHINPETTRLDLIIILADQSAKQAELRHYQNIL